MSPRTLFEIFYRVPNPHINGYFSSPVGDPAEPHPIAAARAELGEKAQARTACAPAADAPQPETVK